MALVVVTAASVALLLRQAQVVRRVTADRAALVDLVRQLAETNAALYHGGRTQLARLAADYSVAGGWAADDFGEWEQEVAG